MFFRRVIAAGGAAAAAALFAGAAVGKAENRPSAPGLAWPPVTSALWDRNWDRREPMCLINMAELKGETEEELHHLLKKYRSRARRHIFLIRHGQYHKRELDSERVLTPLGREQAGLTGHRLASFGYKFDKMVYSTLTRAKETSCIIGKYLPGVPTYGSDLLQEGTPIQPEPPAQWHPDLYYYENGPRIEAAFREYIHRADYTQKDDSYEILVCHDNVIRYIVCRALQVPPDAWHRMSLNHGSITELLIHHNGNVSLRALSDAGYMPVKCLSR